MKNNMISVIIPIYNGKEYITNLCQDFTNQTFQDFEIIFIDDGSTDGSTSLLEFYFGLIRHKIIIQKNLGQGLARNQGVLQAQGEYIVFVDQDDRIPEDYLEILWKKINMLNADVLISGYKIIDNRLKVKKTVYLSNDEWAKFMCIAPWGKIYKKSLIIDNEISFPQLSLGEDIYFNLLIYITVIKGKYSLCVLDNYAGYEWVENKKSYSRTEHHHLSDKTNILVLYNTLLNYKHINSVLHLLDFRYFFLKTAIYHLLYVAPYNRLSVTIKYRNSIFEWIQKNVYPYDRKKILYLKGPKGEKVFTRMCVAIYFGLYLIGCDNFLLAFLRLWGFVSCTFKKYHEKSAFL